MSKLGLVTLVGLPGSGKSSLCRLLKTYSKSPDITLIHIEFDCILPEEVYQPSLQTSTWKRWRNAIADCVERVIQRHLGGLNPSKEAVDLPSTPEHDLVWCWFKADVLPCLKPDTNLILLLDDNFYYQSMRKVYYLMAKYYAHLAQDDVCSRIFNLFPSLLSNPIKRIEQSSTNKTRERQRSINANNLVHCVDIQLRARVAQLMQTNDSEWRAKNGSLIATLKASTLDMVRSSLTFSVDSPQPCSVQDAVDYFNARLDVLI